MKARTVALVAARGRRRRRPRLVAPALRPPPAEPLVQLGLLDGAVRALDRSDPATAELETLAAGVRDSLTGGA